jgi:hypothetical protein
MMFLSGLAANAGEIKVGCGQVIEQEFRVSREVHVFVIDLSPGDVIKATVIPAGDFLNFHGHVHEPAGRIIHDMDGYDVVVHLLEIESGKLDSTGQYGLHVFNHDPHVGQYADNYNGSAGLYTMHVGCVLRDGTEIVAGASGGGGQFLPQPGGNPGAQGEGTSSVPSNEITETASKITQYANEAVETAEGIGQVVSTFKNLFGGIGGKKRKKEQQRNQPPRLPPATAFPSAAPPMPLQAPPMPSQAPPMPPASSQPSVVALTPSAQPAVVSLTPMAPQEGFPGFLAADLAALALPSAGLGMPLQAALVPQPFQVAGFQFTGRQGMKIDLAFERLSGNLSLGLLLLDPNRKLVFQGSVGATGGSVRESLTLPMAGEYKLGIARIEPLPPSPLQTSFSISLIEK